MEITLLVFLVGRVLLGGYFAFNGVMHFLQFKQMVEYAASNGVAYPRLGVFLASVLILFGGLGVLLGVYVTLSLYLLIIFLVPATFLMHAFWKISDPYQRTVARVQFLKNTALLGAVIMLLLLPTPWPLSLI